VQSTLNRLLIAPQVCTNTPPLKFQRFQPHEKAYILTRLRDFTSAGGSQAALCCGIGVSTARMERWLSLHRRYGQAGLQDRGRRKFPNRVKALVTTKQVLEIFHNQPRTYGINRTNWTGKSLAQAFFRQFRVAISGSTAQVFNVTRDTGLRPFFATLDEHQASGIVVGGNVALMPITDQILSHAARFALPTMFFYSPLARAGGLPSYGPELSDTFRQLGAYTGRILKGEKPGDLPVIQPTKFEFVINLKTAKALGLTVPTNLLVRADEVIE
jgi:ABC transporter substrate binding protein